jgi:hypothetical protein
MTDNRPQHRNWLAAYLLAICGGLALGIVAIVCIHAERAAPARRGLVRIGYKLGINSPPTCVNGLRHIRLAVNVQQPERPPTAAD